MIYIRVAGKGFRRKHNAIEIVERQWELTNEHKTMMDTRKTLYFKGWGVETLLTFERWTTLI